MASRGRPRGTVETLLQLAADPEHNPYTNLALVPRQGAGDRLQEGVAVSGFERPRTFEQDIQFIISEAKRRSRHGGRPRAMV
jgi:hypothetical protein